MRSPDFYDRSGFELRCRECRHVFAFGGDSGRDADYLDEHVGERFPCPSCAIDSLIPTLEEAEWPHRKDRDDPVRGVPTTER